MRDSDCSEFVGSLYGIALGPAPEVWRAALGTNAATCLLAAPIGPSVGGGASAGASAPAHLLALVMKWEGDFSLHDLLHSPGGGWRLYAKTDERLRLCAQIASGLRALHCYADLVHGNLEPRTVLLRRVPGVDGRPVVLPRICVPGPAERGTWSSLAPELLLVDEGSAVASRSTDMYALGVLCWEVLTGSRPWEGFTERRMILKLLESQVQGGGTATWPVA